MASEIPIKVEFTGGLEAFFSKRRNHNLTVPNPMTIESLIPYLVQQHMTDPRPEFFVQDGSVRPGILVLVNDADWELEGGLAYALQARDHITFMSTLHGG